MYTQIADTLREEVASFLDLPTEDIDIRASLPEMGIDSLQMLQLLVLLERTFGIHMDEADLQHFTTIHDVGMLAVDRLNGVVEPDKTFAPLAAA